MDSLSSRLNLLSRFTIALGIFCLGSVLLNFLQNMQTQANHSGHPRLRASHGETGSNSDMHNTLTALSTMLWGLVVTKAKQGIDASQNKDSVAVGGMFRKAGQLIILIVVASFVKFGAEVTDSHQQTQRANLVARHRLQAASPTHDAPKKHLDSYYDPGSSHYMGGAHNVALAQLGGEPVVEPSSRFNAQQAAYEDISDVWKNARARN